MTFKATVDIAVNLSSVKIKVLNRQGYIRYRMKIYSQKNEKEEDCHPYNIVKGETQNKKHSIDPDNII